jgi:hypothetical protein
MPKFNVHVFPIVRVKVANIEAETPEQAIGVADLAYRFRWKADHLQLAVEPNPHLEKEYAGFEDLKLDDFKDAEETSHYLVDPLLTIPEDHPDFGAINVDYDNSKWYDKNKKPTTWNVRSIPEELFRLLQADIYTDAPEYAERVARIRELLGEVQP